MNFRMVLWSLFIQIFFLSHGVAQTLFTFHLENTSGTEEYIAKHSVPPKPMSPQYQKVYEQLLAKKAEAEKCMDTIRSSFTTLEELAGFLYFSVPPLVQVFRVDSLPFKKRFPSHHHPELEVEIVSAEERSSGAYGSDKDEIKVTYAIYKVGDQEPKAVEEKVYKRSVHLFGYINKRTYSDELLRDLFTINPEIFLALDDQDSFLVHTECKDKRFTTDRLYDSNYDFQIQWLQFREELHRSRALLYGMLAEELKAHSARLVKDQVDKKEWNPDLENAPTATGTHSKQYE